MTTGRLNLPASPLRGNEVRSLPLDWRPVTARGRSTPTARFTDVLRGDGRRYPRTPMAYGLPRGARPLGSRPPRCRLARPLGCATPEIEKIQSQQLTSRVLDPRDRRHLSQNGRDRGVGCDGVMLSAPNIQPPQAKPVSVVARGTPHQTSRMVSPPKACLTRGSAMHDVGGALATHSSTLA